MNPWLTFILGLWAGGAFGILVMFLFAGARIRALDALDAEANAHLDRAEQHSRTQQSQGAVSVSHGERN